MMSTDPLPEETATDADRVTIDPEAHSDDAWINACRAELEDDDSEDSQTQADRAHSSKMDTAPKQTGDDAMSKFGNAIGALAETEDDLDDRVLDFAAEIASPSSERSARDEAVAPHIAAAERELERSKSGPVDIFDRIAMAAETQFDGSRGNTAKRVSELVDDRRVGTKRWTPSKTMKQRMEKLEAARAAASGDQPQPTAKAEPEAEVEAAPVAAASAPSSAQATMVTPGAEEKTEPKAKVEAAPMTEDQSVTITRRDRQPEVEETIDSETDGPDESTLAESDDELDADGLRVVPGARGRRRDRARKSRLDEDFEKIFDDEGKPSINSLRRKLRSGAAEEAAALAAAEEEAAATGKQGKKKKAAKTVIAETVDTDAQSESKPGLFSRLLNARKGKTEAVETAAEAETAPATTKSKAKKVPAEIDEDELVAAFETSSDIPMVDDLDHGDYMDDEDDENWQDTIEGERKKNQLAMPIIGAGGAILLGGLGWFGYKFLTGM